MTITADDIEKFMAEAAANGHTTTKADARATLTLLQSIERRLHAVFERQCNGHQTPDGRWDEAAAKKDDEREEALTKRAKDLLSPFGMVPRINGDPRGHALGFSTDKTGAYNTWGGVESGWRL